MNWIERQGTHFSGNYRVCRTTQGFFDVWYYSQDKSGVVQKGFLKQLATEAGSGILRISVTLASKN